RRRIVSYAFRETYPKGGRVFRGSPQLQSRPGKRPASGLVGQPAPLVQLAKIRDRPLQPLAELDPGLPVQHLASTGYVRLTNLGVVLRQRALFDLAGRSGNLEHHLSQLRSEEHTSELQSRENLV